MTEQFPLPEWHNPGMEPPERIKRNGWGPGEKPAAQYMNWQMNQTYESLVHFRDSQQQMESSFSQQLAQKAAKNEVNTLATGKADKTYVDGQLTQKANKDEINTLASNKADKSAVQEFKDATGATLAAIIASYELENMEEVTYLTNLWNVNNTVLGTLSETSGNVSAHATIRTTDFIPIRPNQDYSFYTPDPGGTTSVAFKVVFYDGANAIVKGYGWSSLKNTQMVYKSPTNAAYMRITVDQNGQSTFIANIGNEVMSEEGAVYDYGFWGNVPTPPLKESSVETHHLTDGVVTLDKLNDDIANTISPKTIFITNLWDINNSILGGINENTGNITSHATNRVSDYIPVTANQNYAFYSKGLFKIVFFDVNKARIAGYTWISPGAYVYQAPSNATYMRLGIDQISQSTFIANIGNRVMSESDEGAVFSDTYWDNVPNGSVKKRMLANDVLSLLSDKTKEQPFPKKLRFETVSIGTNEVIHLSQDGEVLYLKQGKKVMQSLDDGSTIVEVGTPLSSTSSIQAIRDLADGELLVSTTRSEGTNLKSKIFKTVGYNRANPSNTQFVEVLEIVASQANVNNSWGIDVHDNIVLASEYGLRDVEGARRVYLSTDYGNTWSVIFDQMTYVVDISGAPTWTNTAHIHTVHYDRYWERIWLVVGDNPNTATYYSDDMGTTWEYVPNSGVVQYTGIVSFPDGVVFGSDRSPNGLHYWKRTESKDDIVRINTLETINNESIITHVFQRAFRRYAEKGEIALFAATRIADFRGTYSSVIMGMTDINNPYVLYELDADDAGLGFYVAVGVTKRGNILTSHHNGTNHVILRAKAPLWE